MVVIVAGASTSVRSSWGKGNQQQHNNNNNKINNGRDTLSSSFLLLLLLLLLFSPSSSIRWMCEKNQVVKSTTPSQSSTTIHF